MLWPGVQLHDDPLRQPAQRVHDGLVLGRGVHREAEGVEDDALLRPVHEVPQFLGEGSRVAGLEVRAQDVDKGVGVGAWIVQLGVLKCGK